MERYIIQWSVLVEGVPKTMYHQTISLTNKRSGCTNVYSEHITNNKKSAMVFYTKKEAEGIGNLFQIKGMHEYTILEK